MADQADCLVSGECAADCAGISFVFKVRQRVHSRAPQLLLQREIT
jgi:hypothetical protein